MSKSKMSKENKIYITLFISIIVIGLIVLYLLFTPSYKYSFFVKETNFVSNQDPPFELIQKIAKENDSFILLVEFTNQNSPGNSLITNHAMIPLISVLSAKNKEVLLIAKVMQNGYFTECQSLSEEGMELERISRENCIKLIEDKSVDFGVIEIIQPQNIPNPLVIVEENKITLKTTGSSELLNDASLFIIQLMYQQEGLDILKKTSSEADKKMSNYA